MKLYERIIAAVVWLQKFTIFSPMNFAEDKSLGDKVIQWGNYSIGNNMYPNLFDIFVKYAPTADNLIERVVAKIFGSIPKDIKTKRTTLESTFTDTIYSLLCNAGRDAIGYKKSFAIWVGYNEQGQPNQFKWIPISMIRYVKRDPELFPYTKNEYMIAMMDSELNDVVALYYPYERSRVAEQQRHFTEEHEEDDKLCAGQMLFYNTAGAQTYPDHIYNSMVPLLLTDAGGDTGIMSFLANSDILKTYKKKAGATGADTANGFGGLFDGQVLNSIWGLDRAQDLTSAAAQFGSDYMNTGVKAAGTTEYLNIPNEEPIGNYVAETKFPAFMDELLKIDERTARRLCIPLEIPYEYIYKMDSGVVNQDNREMFIKELNIALEPYRDIFEEVINDILRDSAFDWTLSIPPLGAGKEDVARANENITE